MQASNLTLITRIALLSAPIGNGNLGDEATVAAVIQNLRRRCPTATIYAFSANPEDTRKRHDISAFPITRPRRQSVVTGSSALGITSQAHVELPRTPRERIKATVKALPPVYTVMKAVRDTVTSVPDLFDEVIFLAKSFRRLKGTDLLIVPGSGVLSDHFGGPFNFPYMLFKWSLLTKASRTRLAFLSVGAGPLCSHLSRRLVKYSMSLARYRSCRDMTSKQVLDGLGMRNVTPVFPDLATSLQVDPTPSVPNHRRPIVGINAFPHFDFRYWPVSDAAKYQRYITMVASFASWLIDKRYQVFFFPTQIRADPPVIQDIQNLLNKHDGTDFGNSVLDVPIHNLADLTTRLATTDLVVATRFHGILLSFLFNKPVLAISNHHKMTDLMTEMGQSQYILDIDTFTRESLIERFTSLECNSDTVRRQIARCVSEHRRVLDRQYDLLLREMTDDPIPSTADQLSQ